MEVQVVLEKEGVILPEYTSELAAGMDVRARLDLVPEDKMVESFFMKINNGDDNNIENWALCINPGGRALIPTGIKVAIEPGYEIQVRPRSGLALKEGVTVINTPGTIDADYRGGVGVILINHGNRVVRIMQNDRIAQIVGAKVETMSLKVVEELPSTERGEGGFGHSGKQ